jgi:hypothetical protein
LELNLIVTEGLEFALKEQKFAPVNQQLIEQMPQEQELLRLKAT